MREGSTGATSSQKQSILLTLGMIETFSSEVTVSPKQEALLGVPLTDLIWFASQVFSSQGKITHGQQLAKVPNAYFCMRPIFH